MVDNDGFCKTLLHTLELRYEIPKRKYFTEKAVLALQSAESCLDVQLQPILLITCGKCTPTCYKQGRCTRLIPVVVRQRVLQRATEEWKLTGKDRAVVTDNVSNMAVAAELTAAHSVFLMHVLNVASQGALTLPAVMWLLAKVRKISAFLYRSTIATDTLRRNQRLLDLQHHKLITDVLAAGTARMRCSPGFWSCRLPCGVASYLPR